MGACVFHPPSPPTATRPTPVFNCTACQSTHDHRELSTAPPTYPSFPLLSHGRLINTQKETTDIGFSPTRQCKHCIPTKIPLPISPCCQKRPYVVSGRERIRRGTRVRERAFFGVLVKSSVFRLLSGRQKAIRERTDLCGTTDVLLGNKGGPTSTSLTPLPPPQTKTSNPPPSFLSSRNEVSSWENTTETYHGKELVHGTQNNNNNQQHHLHQQHAHAHHY